MSIKSFETSINICQSESRNFPEEANTSTFVYFCWA